MCTYRTVAEGAANRALQPRPPARVMIGETEEEILKSIILPTRRPFFLLWSLSCSYRVVVGIEKSKSYIIGKDPNSCDIVFQDLSVSKNHARISVDANGIITIEDLNSKNGTLVNGSPISELTTITPNDLIALGTTSCLIIDREAGEETIYAAPEVSHIPEQAQQEKVAAKTPVEWKKQIIPINYLVLAGSLCVIVFVMFIA